MRRFCSRRWMGREEWKGGEVAMSDGGVRVTVSGSFRKHLARISDVIRELEDAGVEVASPRSVRAEREHRGFVRVEGDKGSAREIELGHLRALLSSDALYVVNPEGYVGTSTALEIGAAVSALIPVFTLESPSDVVLAQLSRVVPPRCVAEVLRANGNSVLVGGTLSNLQRYFRLAAEPRGFGHETAHDLVLLLVEEVGELARAVRRRSGIPHRGGQSRRDRVEFELADCLIYVLSLANALDIDIASALGEKEKLNARRIWINGG